MAFNIVQGDTTPAIIARLTDAGQVIDLSNVNNVEFHMEDKFNRVVISDDLNGNVNIVNASRGEVEYNWQAGDTDNVGSYEAEWEVTYNNGGIETFPSIGKVQVEITEDIE